MTFARGGVGLHTTRGRGGASSEGTPLGSLPTFMDWHPSGTRLLCLDGEPCTRSAVQAQAELDRLIQLEYWLKYDFTGCVRKLLPARQQVGGEARQPWAGWEAAIRVLLLLLLLHACGPPRFLPRRGTRRAKHLVLLCTRMQAQCMVASYPFYPDQRQLEGAIKDKAGQLWEQLQRAA